MEQTKNVSPVIKWAGGKRQLLPTIKPMFPERNSRKNNPQHLFDEFSSIQG